MKYFIPAATFFSLVSCAEIMLLFGPDQPPFHRYEFFTNARIVDHTLDAEPVAAGNSYILAVTEGVGASKTTSIHTSWNTIYLVLPDPPVVGVKQTVTRIYRNGYTRGTNWAVEPNAILNITVVPVRLNDSHAEFNITGTVPLKKWRRARPDSKITKEDTKSRLGNLNVLWESEYHYSKFDDKTYEFHRADSSK